MIPFSFFDKLSQAIGDSVSSPRKCAAVLAVLTPFASVGDALLGVASAFLTLLPLGHVQQQRNYERFSKQISTLGWIIPIAYVLRCINPNAFPDKDKEYQAARPPILQWIEKQLAGMEAATCELAASSDPFKRHVTARVGYLARTAFFVVMRAFLLAVGPFALLMALTCKADNFHYNALAFTGFAAPAVVGDLLKCALRCINPSLTPAQTEDDDTL